MSVGCAGRQKKMGSPPWKVSCPPQSALTPRMKGKDMATVAQPTIKAKYVQIYDEPATIAKVHGAFYVLYPDGRIEDFSIEMAPFTTVLGDVALSETQAMWDRLAGGA